MCALKTDYGGYTDNCGVTFDESWGDDDTGGGIGETETAILECSTEDVECLEDKRKSAELEGARKSRPGSLIPNVDGLDIETIRRLSLQARGIDELAYQGLSEDITKKHYKPDYPDELEMKTICKPKPKRKIKGAAGGSKTHPAAAFVPDPSVTAAASQRRESGLSEKLDQAEIERIWAEPSPLEINRMPPPVVSSSDEAIVNWLDAKNIQIMFEYFLGLCVIHQPSDPFTFIAEICGLLIDARTDSSAFNALPRLLSSEHIEAIFRIYDRIEGGAITLYQYKNAMESMGFAKFSRTPDGYDDNAIGKEAFVKAGNDAVNDMLISFMGEYNPVGGDDGEADEEEVEQDEEEIEQGEEEDEEEGEEEEEDDEEEDEEELEDEFQAFDEMELGSASELTSGPPVSDNFEE